LKIDKSNKTEKAFGAIGCAINDKSYRFLTIDFGVDFWLIITMYKTGEKNFRLVRLPAAAQSQKTLKI